MIKLWIHPRFTLYYPVGKLDRSNYKPKFHRIQGNIDLSNPSWYYDMVFGPSDIKIGIEFLNKGFKI